MLAAEVSCYIFERLVTSLYTLYSLYIYLYTAIYFIQVGIIKKMVVTVNSENEMSQWGDTVVTAIH